jgi:iron complex transport system substrate-binding protein
VGAVQRDGGFYARVINDWGYPMPEAMGVGELWMAKKLYPEKFKDVDVRKVANDWYQRFYRTDYQGID